MSTELCINVRHEQRATQVPSGDSQVDTGVKFGCEQIVKGFNTRERT